jgi:hypothetical protein
LVVYCSCKLWNKPYFFPNLIKGGSNMTGTNRDLFTHKSCRSYLNHLVYCRIFMNGLIKNFNVICTMQRAETHMHLIYPLRVFLVPSLLTDVSNSVVSLQDGLCSVCWHFEPTATSHWQGTVAVISTQFHPHPNWPRSTSVSTVAQMPGVWEREAQRHVLKWITERYTRNAEQIKCNSVRKCLTLKYAG